ncbi:MAG: roadblock/LC7 domain-containing protein [Sphaerobacter sp.]|nr:roadblock/LC7 domain-containing protein [Sphaerobacter sp.]
MEQHLLALLDYHEVLSVVATTVDGLVVATAGLDGDDAELVAASGSALAQLMRRRGERSGRIDVPGGALHVVVGDELMLVALTEDAAPEARLVEVMSDALARLTGTLRDGDAAR